VPSTRRGQLLIASPRLQDPNFVRSVVLIVHHDENGAMGVILNRPLELTVKDALSQLMDGPVELEQPLHVGGPCEGPLVVVHTRKELADDEEEGVLPGVFFAAERTTIEQLLEDAAEAASGIVDPPAQLKFFVNYAGWGLEQLENEIDSGAWLTAPASPEQIFEGTTDKLWSKLFAAITYSEWVDPSRIPDDPSVN
jgi:putative transcriptional regulator